MMTRTLSILMAVMVVAALLALNAATVFAAPPKCPPGQTATVTVVGTGVVETCRVLQGSSRAV
jgi:hypothetical protein